MLLAAAGDLPDGTSLMLSTTTTTMPFLCHDTLIAKFDIQRSPGSTAVDRNSVMLKVWSLLFTVALFLTVLTSQRSTESLARRSVTITTEAQRTRCTCFPSNEGPRGDRKGHQQSSLDRNGAALFTSCLSCLCVTMECLIVHPAAIRCRGLITAVKLAGQRVGSTYAAGAGEFSIYGASVCSP